MANMSDLVTADIGIIAFWNALDHWIGPGANEIDPTQCAGVFDSVNYYDNGIEGYKALGSGRYFHARVKSDGWMVAWIDRTNTFFFPTKLASDFGEHTHKGYYDILKNWFTHSANISSTQTTLSYLIALLYNTLSNKIDFNYSDADVGHFCYEFTEANAMTLLSKHVAGAIDTGQVRYTTGTSIYYAAVAGAVSVGGGLHADVDFASNVLIDCTGVPRKAVADILAEGWMPNPLTDYALYVVGWGAPDGTLGSILILWS